MAIHLKYFYFFLPFLLFFYMGDKENGNGNRKFSTNTLPKSDTTEVHRLNQLAEQEISDTNGSIETSIQYAAKALDLSEKLRFNYGIVKSNLNLGNAYKLKRDFPVALDHYIQASQIAEKINNPNLLFTVYKESAKLYLDWNIPDKVTEYLSKAKKIAESENDISKENEISYLLAIIYRNNGDIDKAEKQFIGLAEYYRKVGDQEALISTNEQLINIYINSNQSDKALSSSFEILNIKKEAGDKAGELNYYNKIGIIYKQIGSYSASLKSFQESLDLSRELGRSEDESSSIMISMGVVYQTMQDFEKALNTYNTVLEIKRKGGDSKEISRVINYLVTIYMGTGNHQMAKAYCQEAIDFALEDNDKETLEKNYKRLAEILESAGQSKKALAVYKQYLEIKEEFYAEEKRKQDELNQKQVNAEKKEKELSMLLADKQMQGMAMEKLQAETAKKEQELKNLKQQQDLQEAKIKAEQYEKQRVAQALKLAEQKLKAQKKQKELNTLQKEKELQDLELKQKVLEEQEKAQKIELLAKNNKLLETERKLQEQQLAEEATMRQYGYGLIGLFALVFVVIIFAFIMKQKANKKLKAQQNEIAQKNEELQASEEELRQNMEELEATQEAMAQRQIELEESNGKLRDSETKIKEQNHSLESAYTDLEDKNLRLTYSIKYAERIQNAILPVEENINQVFDSHFVMFQPKDMVSGDFYWFCQIDNKSFIATVDCTGHGVPGAFMSMIGNTLLNQIVKEKGIYAPEKILEAMHYSVRDALKQRDSKNVDGMDIGLCCLEMWEDGLLSLSFSGAKCPMFHYSKDGNMSKVSPDRKSIGGYQKDVNHSFTAHKLKVEKGDMIYLTTDGIIDAANSNRRRLGTSKLSQMIEKHAHRPAYEQKIQFERELEEHQIGADQRDDIT
nr:tetratricopeptide repeat protein [Flammeovirgaceae bacterium]